MRTLAGGLARVGGDPNASGSDGAVSVPRIAVSRPRVAVEADGPYEVAAGWQWRMVRDIRREQGTVEGITRDFGAIKVSEMAARACGGSAARLRRMLGETVRLVSAEVLLTMYARGGDAWRDA